MICYRDMTFCSSWAECAKGATCPRSLTPEVLAAADRWWGKGPGEAPICTYFDVPACFEARAE